MKVYFVPAEAKVFGNLNEALEKAVNSMRNGDKLLSEPVIQKKSGYWSNKNEYYIKVPVYDDYRKKLFIRRRKLVVVEIEPDCKHIEPVYYGEKL